MTERIFKIFPAFDKRDPDPKKNYGIHGCEMLFVVKGDKGAVQFKLFTNWQLPHVTEEQDARILAKANAVREVEDRIKVNAGWISEGVRSGIENVLSRLKKLFESGSLPIWIRGSLLLDQVDLDVTYHPIPADLGYHSPVPMYPGQKAMGSQKEIPGAMERNLERARSGKGIEDWEPTHEDTDDFGSCEYVDGGRCFYDGSGINASKVYDRMLREGSDGVWAALEEYYANRFSNRIPTLDEAEGGLLIQNLIERMEKQENEGEEWKNEGD